MRLDFGRTTCNVWLQSMLTAMLLAGCGGGGGGGAGGGPAPPTGGGPIPRGTVLVTATDAFGNRLAGAEVSVYMEGGNTFGKTDAEGHSEIRGVHAGAISVAAYHGGPAGVGLSGVASATLKENERVDVAVTLIPASDVPFSGTGSSVDAVPDPDGRVLEFSLPVFPLIHLPNEEWTSLTFQPCTPDSANDGESPFGDCIVGPAGFDAEYTVANAGNPVSTTVWSLPSSAPLRYVELLLDQSVEMAGFDPFDARLYGARYAASLIGEDDRIAVAAFAADDPSGSEISNLEHQPLTVYPTSSPQFLPPSDALAEAIAALSEREGGIAPLYAAMSEGLDFIVANVPQGERRAAVLLTDGQDDTCADAAECTTARHAVGARAIAQGVEIVAVGILMSDDAASSAARGLAALVEDTNGSAVWVTDKSQLGIALHTALSWRNDSEPAPIPRFRLESPTPGAFTSGYTVHGVLSQAICPWDCYYVTVPVAIWIP